MKSVLKKLIVLLGIVAVIALGAGVDAIIAASYKIDFIKVERLGDEKVTDSEGNELAPDIGVADGTTYVRFVIKLTRGGVPVQGHVLYVKTNRNILERKATDENGEIVVDYRCYKASSTEIAAPVTLTVKDENNSVFVAVPATNNYVLKMVKPHKSSGSGMKTDEIFFPI